MSTLKEKSEINLQAALKLTENEPVCLVSVHCSYYSCYQLLTYFIEKTHSISPENCKKKYNDYLGDSVALKNKLGSHEFWINEFFKDYKQKKAMDANIVLKNLSILKKARLDADYKDTEFSKKETDVLYDIALNVRKMIFKTYEP